MYYTGMAQPKTPPLSIRPPAELMARVDALAGKRGVARHAALLDALRLGVEVMERDARKPQEPPPKTTATQPAAPATKPASAAPAQPEKAERKPRGYGLDGKPIF